MDVVIAGLGLIGGSLGMALRRQGWRVGFADPAVSLDEARQAGAADDQRDGLDGEIVVLATPADVAVEILGRLGGTRSFVTSVSSVMVPLCDAASGLNFVAGHPFAGSEQRGLSAARPDLLAGHPWFIQREEPQLLQMIAAAGGEAVVVDPDEHDRVMALTSHLPQVIATALGSLLEPVDPRFIGSGARSMLRLAGSAYEIWQPILEQNETHISAAAEELWQIMRRLGAEDFERARRLYGGSAKP